MENQQIVRKIRALPRVWKVFCQIPNGDAAYLGRIQVCKTSFCTAREYEFCSVEGAIASIGKLRFVFPWRRVKTTRLVRDSGKVAVTEGLSKIPVPTFTSLISGGKFPENAGQTHYVGDDCPGGHHDLVKQLGELQTELNSLPESKKAGFTKEINAIAEEIGVARPSGHHEIAKQVGPAPVAKSMVIPQGGEPNNDNNITGPSC